MIDNFCKYVLNNGGDIRSLEIGSEHSEGLGLCNPSVFVLENGQVMCSIRRVNYAFQLTTTHYWKTVFGATNYHHPDNDVNLRTDNFICMLDKDFNIIKESVKKVNYQPYEPKWNFVGEEDVRIVKWNGMTYLTGCRRDTENTGISRMELSVIDGNANEMSRERIKSLGNDDSYCEKNWMPILDQPYCYVKWCNPLEIVEYNPVTKTTTQKLIKDVELKSNDPIVDLRGSSQVISVDGYNIALVHEVILWRNRYNEKEARYYNRFIVWDSDWNVVSLSDRFLYMDFPVEFGVGLAYRKGEFIIPFSVYDNAPFLLTAPKDVIFSFCGIGQLKKHNRKFDKNLYTSYIYDIYNPYKAYDIGLDYYARHQWASAHAFFFIGAEKAVSDKEAYRRIGYDCFYMAQKCLEHMGNRLDKLAGQYGQLVDWDCDRYEAYHELSKIYYGGSLHRNDHNTALTFAAIAKSKLDDAANVRGFDDSGKYLREKVLLQYYICCYRCLKDYAAVEGLVELRDNGCEEISEEVKKLGLNL